jgi:hypothetical protein
VKAYIAHVGCAQQCITNGVYQHIGITVAQQSQTVVNLYTPQPKVAVFHQTVDVIAHAYSYIHSLFVVFVAVLERAITRLSA